MKTFKFKLYNHKRSKYLSRTIDAASSIYNHCIALHKRYYRMWKKHLNKNRLQKHIAKLRKRNPFWGLVDAQAVQNITERIQKGYELFFKHHKQGVRPPNFKKRIKYKSFTLKQNGYKFLNGGRVKIQGRVYQYWNSREIEGVVKTVTIKRTPLGELFMFVTCAVDSVPQVEVAPNKIAGFDFGLKQFLTCSEGFSIDSPQFLRQSLNDLRRAHRNHSRKQKGLKSREKARLHLCRVYEKMVNRRTDWFWKLAHDLTDRFDVLCFETLNLDGMKRLWGRKVSDLAFGDFMQILKWVAVKKGKVVVQVDPWFPSSKTCSHCGWINKKLELSDRLWRCGGCHEINDRDENASINIKKAGVLALGLGNVSRALPAIAA